jgi:hypothetical protein
MANKVDVSLDGLKQQLEAELMAFHNDEAGLNTVETIMLLFIAGVILYAVNLTGKDIWQKTSTKIKALLDFDLSY